jgi:hypothetical protein
MQGVVMCRRTRHSCRIPEGSGTWGSKSPRLSPALGRTAPSVIRLEHLPVLGAVGHQNLDRMTVVSL